MSNEITVNLDGLPRPLAAAVRYLADLSWQVDEQSIFLPTVDVSRMLGLPIPTLTYWARKGHIKARKVGYHWRIDPDDARLYMIRNS